jgi:protein Mpv17
MARAAFAAYDRALTRFPILTKTVTSVVLFSIGDIFAQTALEGRETLDMARLARQGAWGVLFTPLAHGWYGLLDKMVPGKTTLAVVAKKTALDQLTWTPVINTVFLSSVTLMSTGSVADAVQAVQDKLWPVLKVNWVVWPLLSAINLGLVPPPYRLLFVNFASLGWSAYLSLAANAKAGAPPAATAGGATLATGDAAAAAPGPKLH